MMTIILPASGFGRRNPDQPVKELMFHQGRSLIELSFEHIWQAQNIPLKTVIVTREEKLAAFQEWLEAYRSRTQFNGFVEFIIHEPREGEEWPMTLLASRPQWSATNLILLPDTNLMLHTPLIATFEKALMESASAWGIVKKDLAEVGAYGMIDRQNRSVTEKPVSPSSPWVWGCFGFQKSYGAALLQGLEQSTATHRPFRLPESPAFIELEVFEDLSRKKKET